MNADPELRTDIYFKRTGTFERQDAILDGRTWHYMHKEVAWTGSERNKTLIRAFQQHLFARGSKQYRVGKLTQNLRLISDLVGKDFDSLTKADAEGFLAKVNRRESWSPHTRRDYMRNFKQFFLWFEEEDHRLNNGDEDKREIARKFYRYVRTISTAQPRKVLDYSAIITDADCLQFIRKGCQNSLERGFVAVLHESGVRIGELLGMRIRDIERKERHALVKVDGKTGERRVPIIQSLPWLDQWLVDHPARDNPNALVWVSNHNGHKGEPLRYIGALKLLSRAIERSGLQKRDNPHWFRHSRATILASRYPEQVLCRMMGWELGSKQVRTYVHIGAKQVEEEFLREQGLGKSEEKQQKIQFCVCGATNPSDGRYCLKCGNALSVGTMLEDESKKTAAVNEAFEFFQKILSDPVLCEKFNAFTRKKES